MNSKAPPEAAEQRLVLLGLAAKQAAEVEPDACPSAEQLAAFIDHQLAGEARQRLLAHLNRCPACLDHWLVVTTCLAEVTKPTPQTQSAGPLVEIWRRLKTWRRSWVLLAPAAALVMVCLVVLWPWLSTPNLYQQIDAGYAATLAQRPTGVTDALHDLPLPWQRTPFTFSESPPTLPARAFGAGLWAGREELLAAGEAPEPPPEDLIPPDQAWSDSRWADYYAFGRWTALVWVLAQADQAAADGERHQNIVDELRKRFTGRAASEAEAKQAVQALRSIRPWLPALSDPTDEPARRQLKRQLSTLIYRFGSTS